ncbi:DUF2007 domain-containing protein [Gemmata sp. G18]|uniref:DUF2007 domain-containing protein n=1 Tax=Gemmata palustris TaxID=2822762 RepID=A0ABS5BY93_9BACT|nr:DUF2007 domain-containing protein [Gemmata palustris]MBP3958711.1 DUF2007 domain-containing protein [Gemmata palustris]
MAGRLVTIATFDELIDAHTAKGALEAAGIQMHLDNEQASSLFGQVMLPIGIRLVVREEDEPQAVKVLDETFGTHEPVDEADLAVQAEATLAEDAADAAEPASAANPTADSVAREKDARLAFQAAVIGNLMPLVALFALRMIRRASTGPGELSPRGRWNLRAAILLSIWPLFLVGIGGLSVLVVAIFMLLSPLLG